MKGRVGGKQTGAVEGRRVGTYLPATSCSPVAWVTCSLLILFPFPYNDLQATLDGVVLKAMSGYIMSGHCLEDIFKGKMELF